jgi:hypothetical protein
LKSSSVVALHDEFDDSTPADVLDRYTKTIDADDRTLVRLIENAVRNGTIQKLATGTLDPVVLAKTMQDFKNAVAAVVRLGWSLSRCRCHRFRTAPGLS